MFDIPVSSDLMDLLPLFGAYADLGVVTMETSMERFAEVTALPQVTVMSPTYQGTFVVPPDTTLTGQALYRAANTFYCRLQLSEEFYRDTSVDLASAVIGKTIPALAKALDFCAFMGSGTDDLTSGAILGLFNNTAIKTYQAPLAGQSNVLALTRGDFLAVVGTVASAALQRPCRWYVNPSFLPSLATLKDGTGDTYLLRSPSYTGDGWELVGFPVTWTAVAPSTNQTNQKVAAFGEPSSYLVAIREYLDMMASDTYALGANLKEIRAILRGNCMTREPTGFATLTLSAQ
jgi:HK97 family phage major capsid protein